MAHHDDPKDAFSATEQPAKDARKPYSAPRVVRKKALTELILTSGGGGAGATGGVLGT